LSAFFTSSGVMEACVTWTRTSSRSWNASFRGYALAVTTAMTSSPPAFRCNVPISGVTVTVNCALGFKLPLSNTFLHVSSVAAFARRLLCVANISPSLRRPYARNRIESPESAMTREGSNGQKGREGRR
jgi:hypothetical protein